MDTVVTFKAPINITNLYKRAANGNILRWSAEMFENELHIRTTFGVLNGNLSSTFIFPTKAETKSLIIKYNRVISDKKKEGYKELSEIADKTPVEASLIGDQLLKWLDNYLPKFNSGVDGTKLPMLAKTFEFEKVSYPRIAQAKINGYRCTINPVLIKDGLFGNRYDIVFKSREGNEFKLESLRQWLLDNGIFNDTNIKFMLDSDISIDGEIYYPQASIYEIKTMVSNDSKLLEFWAYDLMEIGFKQSDRLVRLREMFEFQTIYDYKELAVYNKPSAGKGRFHVIPSLYCRSDKQALEMRNYFVSIGFEGVILRDVEAEYQFGRRNNTMIKFKPIYESRHKVLDIVPEGDARPDLPKFLLLNDLNDSTFYGTILGSFEVQKQYLLNKDKYIGKVVELEYRERSKDTDIPIHAKITKFV